MIYRLAQFFVFTFLVLGLFAHWIAPHTYNEVVSSELRLKPSISGDFILGTDDLGRDVLSRLLKGTQVSVGLGLLAVIVALFVGGLLALICVASMTEGRARLDFIIMRIVDFMLSIPSVLLALLLMAAVGPGILNTILAVSLTGLPHMIRVARSALIEETKSEYFLYLRSWNASFFRKYIINLLPGATRSLTAQAAFAFSDAVLTVGALGFLGLGVPAPIPEWGTMLADARPFLETDPWLALTPMICILLVVLSINLLGDQLAEKWSGGQT